MTTLAVSLDEDLEDFVQGQAAAKGLASGEDYVRMLLTEELRRQERKHLEGLLIEGIESGPPIEVNEKFWDDLRREALDELRREKSGAKAE